MQINIKCTKCHKFLAKSASKWVSKTNFRAVAKCEPCNVFVLNRTYLKNNEKTIESTCNLEIAEQTYKNYIEQYTSKMARLKFNDIKKKVLNFLKNNIATAEVIAKRTELRKSLVSKALNMLRKEHIIRKNIYIFRNKKFGAEGKGICKRSVYWYIIKVK